ncbi:MFS transporter [Lysinibacillus sphaericus]|uniref:MFS transporter n=1 Tax=Lysinibacillus sphaericus TaxID=1421 RepID=UPI0018CE103B|nr:MFS transporter [Lysinibacillus sphaericus]MBG9455924.1 MFS transporter [Lysinibacillus sphaericus]MBG9479569.1 MFS transporter [Lysinibacillus sphaericus]MBG9593950.1 MFS transporter [Lysinibacillus sphaericus]
MNQGKGIFGPQYFTLTIGIILTISAVAFEGLAVTTVAPLLASELNGMELYGWVFSAYLLAQLIGTILAGQYVDQHGPTLPFIIALLLFGLGLFGAAVASNMFIMIVARALQGLGAGALINCIYTSITIRYPDSLRAQILAAFSSAYVLPALIGPYIAGVIAEHLSWRFVFWGIIPILLVSAILTIPTFKKIISKRNTERKSQFLSPIVLTISTGMLITGLGWLPKMSGVVLSIIGSVILFFPLRSLLPPGTFIAQSGLPAIIASRGLFMACYWGTQTYIVLMLTSVKGFAVDIAGLVVASASVSWSLAAWLQAKFDKKDHGQGRRKRVIVGVGLMVLGISAVMPIVWMSSTTTSIIIAVTSQIVMGFGIGLANPTSSAIAFEFASSGAEGKISADLQIADTFTPAVGIGIGGALIAISKAVGWESYIGITTSIGLQIVLILFSLMAAFQLPKKVS